MDEAVSMEIQREPDGAYIALAQSLASIHIQAAGEREEGEESLRSHKKVTDWVPQQKVLGFDMGTEQMTISLPHRNIGESVQLFGHGSTSSLVSAVPRTCAVVDTFAARVVADSRVVCRCAR